jgi:hypothetical protein
MASSEAALVRIAGATISDSTANGLDSTAIVKDYNAFAALPLASLPVAAG